MLVNLIAAQDDDGRRLDRIIRKILKKTSLPAIHSLFRRSKILVDGKAAPASFRVRAGQTISFYSSSSVKPVPDPEPISPPPGVLEILFEGEGIIILNKAPGLLVHGKKSLEEQVLSYLKDKIPPSLSFKPGPLHRLDRQTSGIIAFSTSLEGARGFSRMMRERRIKKQYLAIVHGVIKKAEVWQDELVRDKNLKKSFASQMRINEMYKAKTALTIVTPLASNAGVTFILAEIETGRTHQIRLQAALKGHPLLGDKKYGGFSIPNVRNRKAAFLLHAWRMKIPAPFPAFIEAPLPEKMREKIKELFGIDSVYLSTLV